MKKGKPHTILRTEDGRYIQYLSEGYPLTERVLDRIHYFPNMKGGHGHRRNYEQCVWGCGRYTKHVWCDDLEMFIPGECKRCQQRRAIHRKVQEELNK